MHFLPGQASIELIAILGVALVAILFFTVFTSGILGDLGVQQDTKEARKAVQALAEAADLVYLQGEGATKTVLVTLPPTTLFGANDTFVGKPASSPGSAPSNMVRIRLGDNDIFAFSRAPLAGSLPTSPGSYLVNVTSRGSYVSIGSGLVSASPNSIRVQMGRSSSKAAFVTFSVLTNETIVAVNITKNWSHASPNINITPSSFSSNGFASVSSRIDVSTDADDIGTYEGEVLVGAWKTTDSQAVQNFRVPISVEVRVG